MTLLAVSWMVSRLINERWLKMIPTNSLARWDADMTETTAIMITGKFERVTWASTWQTMPSVDRSGHVLGPSDTARNYLITVSLLLVCGLPCIKNHLLTLHIVSLMSPSNAWKRVPHTVGKWLSIIACSHSWGQRDSHVIWRAMLQRNWQSSSIDGCWHGKDWMLRLDLWSCNGSSWNLKLAQSCSKHPIHDHREPIPLIESTFQFRAHICYPLV